MPDNPQVFISYSWDSDEHKGWVRSLTDRLIHHGANVTLDQYDLRGGQDRHVFMETGVRNASHVIVVCTPKYVDRANDRKRGVGEETSLITGDFYEREKTGKEFIPIVRSTVDKQKTPDYLSSLVYVDFTDDVRFDKSYEELLRVIYNTPRYAKPPRGSRPDLAPAGAPSPRPAPVNTSISALHSRVVNSNPDEWSHDDDRGIYTSRSDALLQIRQIRKDRPESFCEDWAKQFPDPVAYRDLYELYYNNNFIEEYFFVAVDGFRMSIPLPQSGQDLRISTDEYQVGRIINTNRSGRGEYRYDDYLSRAGITVDATL